MVQEGETWDEGTYIKFIEGPPAKSGLTRTWWVVQTRGDLHLGWIGWWASWRRYAFYPKEKTVYEETCLGEIAAFIVQETERHRALRKKGHNPVKVSRGLL